MYVVILYGNTFTDAGQLSYNLYMKKCGISLPGAAKMSLDILDFQIDEYYNKNIEEKIK